MTSDVERRLTALREMLDLLPAAPSPDETLASQVTGILGAALEELETTVAELNEQNEQLEAVRAELVYERQRFIDLFHHAPDPYVVTNPSGVIQQANAAAGRLLGTPVDDLGGWPLLDFLREGDRPMFTNVLRAATEEQTSSELVMTPRNHPHVVVAASVVRRRGRVGRPVELWWLLRDVTDARRAQAALQEAFARTSEEAEELRDLDRWKDAFLSAAAHDLRAPLAVVGTTVGVLLSEHQLGPARSLVESIGSEARRLTQLLDDLLDLDRFTRGTVTAERAPTDLADVVGRALADAHVDDRQVQVDVPSVVVEVDPARVGQIVVNLVRNAWTHTPRGTAIRVRVDVVEDGVDLVVEDEGPGVPSSLREEVFRPFVTRRAHEAGVLGTGLGLSLVQLFAELHQGTARVDERPGGGTRVVVHLPARVHG